MALRELADARIYARGEAYFHDGAVGLLDADAFEVSADVQGTQRYRVRLAASVGDELEYECDCPVGDDGIWFQTARSPPIFSKPFTTPPKAFPFGTRRLEPSATHDTCCCAVHAG